MPAISFIIPAYNEGKYIGKTLQSIKDQTFKDFELIVVDNNSTDNTAEIARSFGAKVIAEKNQGYVFSLNRGVSEATSEIIAVTDADTIVPPDYLEKIKKCFEDPKVAAVGGLQKMGTGGKISDFVFFIILDLFMRFHFLVGKPHLIGNCMAFLRKKNAETGGIDLKDHTSADVKIGLRLRSVGKVIYDPNIVVVTSSRRWEKNTLKQTLGLIGAYIKVIWLGGSVTSDLEPIR